MKTLIFRGVNLYISESGSVLINGRELHQTDNGKGYKSVSIKDRSIQIHRLVAFAYIPNPENKKEVNHKDLNKSNNHFSNLEWATRKENAMHAYLNGAIKPPINSRLTKQDILEIHASNLPVSELCKKFNCTQPHVSNIKNGHARKDITQAVPKKKTALTKLDNETVISIFTSRSSITEIMRRFKVTRNVVSGIRNGYKYARITLGTKNKLQ